MTEGYFDRRWQSWRWDDDGNPDDADRAGADRTVAAWDDDDRWEAMRRARDRRPEEPTWVTDPTNEWAPLPGQRYPGDPSSRRRPRRDQDPPPPPPTAGVGRATVYQPGPGRGRPGAEEQPEEYRRREPATRRHPDDAFRQRPHSDDVFHRRPHPDDVFHQRGPAPDRYRGAPPPDRGAPPPDRGAPPPDQGQRRGPAEPYTARRITEPGRRPEPQPGREPPARPPHPDGQPQQWERPRERPAESPRRDDRTRSQPDPRAEQPWWPTRPAEAAGPPARPEPARPQSAEVYRAMPATPPPPARQTAPQRPSVPPRDQLPPAARAAAPPTGRVDGPERRPTPPPPPHRTTPPRPLPTAPDQTGEQLPIPVSAPAGPPPEFRVSTATGEHPQVRPVRREQAADATYVVRAKPEPRHAPPPYIVRDQPEREVPPSAVVRRTAPTATPTSAPPAAEAPVPVSPAPPAPVSAAPPVAEQPAPPVPVSGAPADGGADADDREQVGHEPARHPVDADLDAAGTAGADGHRPVDGHRQVEVEQPPGEPPAASPDTVLPVTGTAAGAATALGAPTMLAPLVRPDEPAAADATDQTRPPTDPPAPAEPAPADPEQVLSAYRWRFHHETLRELVENPDDLRAIRDRLTEKIAPATDNATRARLLSLRAVVSRILGDLGKALADAKLALAHAEATGELRRIAIAQARLAHVLQWRGDFAEADRLFEEANSAELPDRLRATMHEHAGRSCYDQGRYMEACNHFERALELRKVEDPDLIARTELALDAVFAKVAENGWGPYPRQRDEILQLHRAPRPTFSDQAQCWGYADADGQLVIAPAFADVQPFHEGVAWVRRPESRFWELIDESGAVRIAQTAGYISVGSYSDGLAWVTADGTGSWIAIDRDNTVVIGAGFDDVRPFRRGVAVVRRGGWGAVDKTGRLLLPTRYGGFPTALTDGRYIDGFTDEGLAIIDAGGRKGVVDRSGRVIVPPVHPAMAIHPVAFLVAVPSGRWGALDRRGEPLIDPVHPSRTAVMDEIDRLLADTKPVL
ncbi:WG repeat-containing protein [Solwaraspora sp. WMMA2101]|uniref:WG repeat-containing protein n=1 Tax=Solwaraspora sp. WMMA2101 TaxID=3404124 RepID=UPI003B92F249